MTTKIISQKDSVYIRRVVGELYEKFFIDVDYFGLDTGNTVVNTLYNESMNRMYKQSIRVPVYITRPNNAQELTKYGLDDDVVREIWLSKEALDRSSLISVPGDIVRITNGLDNLTDLFEVVKVERPDWFLTYNIIFDIRCLCRYLRPGVTVTLPT